MHAVVRRLPTHTRSEAQGKANTPLQLVIPKRMYTYLDLVCVRSRAIICSQRLLNTNHRFKSAMLRRLRTHRASLLPSVLPLLLLLLLAPPEPTRAATIRGVRAKKRPAPQQQPPAPPELTLASCNEPALNGTNGTIPLFDGRFTDQSFPFCKVLNPGRAVLYWTWTNASQTEDGAVSVTGPAGAAATNGTATATNGTATATSRTRVTPSLPTDAGGVKITMGVLLRRNLSTTTTASSWAALGLSEESQGMPGMDVAMLRGPDEVRWIEMG
jgi:hypothetical protein